jgi:hypothetical protein
MSLLDIIRGIPERMGRRQERNIGGLLGIDPEDMTEEERRQARRLSQMAVFDAMARGTSPIAGLREAAALLGSQREARQERQTSARAAQDINQASAAIAARLGGRGADVGEQTVLEEVRPMSGMNLPALLASQAGSAAVQANPQLAEMIKQQTGRQVVGGSIYDRATGQFITPPAPMRGTTAQAAPAQAAPAGPRFRTLSAEDIASAGLPAGTVAQVDEQTGQVKILSAVPATQRTSGAEKEKTVQRVDSIAETITGAMDKVATGGPLGVRGALSRVFDSQDAKLFESLRQQLSSAIRAALRIKGEGALSDFEQKQYGLQLPELGLNKENNLLILRSLQNQVRLAAGLDPLPMEEQESPFKVTRED